MKQPDQLATCTLLVASILGATSSTVAAKSRPLSVGPYGQLAIGAKDFFGAHKNDADRGPAFSLHAGSDIFSWFSVGGRLNITSHEARTPSPPDGEYFQLYGLAAEARLSIPVRRISVFAEAAIGYSWLSTNILERVGVQEPGQRASLSLTAGGGLEYQLQNRHYAFGLGAEWTTYPSFDSLQSITAHASLRYTY